MKSPILTLLSALALFSPLVHGAGEVDGPRTGGGGKAIVCRVGGKIKSVETLDLWEAREIQKLKIPASSLTVAKQVELATERLKNLIHYATSMSVTDAHGNTVNYSGGDSFAYRLRESAKLFLQASPNVDRLHGKTLTPTPDALEDAYPANCTVEQAVIFHDDSDGARVLVNQDLVDRMDAQNQAALYTHEVLYKTLREIDGEGNSLRTRRAVGLAFSGVTFAAPGSFVPDQFLYCSDLTATGEPTTELVFFLDAAIVQPTDPSGLFDASFTIIPLRMDGIESTDFNRNNTGASFGFGLMNLDDLSSRVSRLVDPNLIPSATSASHLGHYMSRTDLEFSGELVASTYPNTDSITLSVTKVRSPWSTDSSSEKKFLQCVPADKKTIFP